MPWPFSNRVNQLRACGLSIPEKRSAYLTLNSFEEDFYMGTSFPHDESKVYMEMKNSCLQFQMVESDKQLMRLQLQMNPKLKNVPKFIINFFFRKVFSIALNMFEQRAQKPPQEQLKLMEEKSDFYNQVKERIERVNNFDQEQPITDIEIEKNGAQNKIKNEQKLIILESESQTIPYEQKLIQELKQQNRHKRQPSQPN